MPVLRRSSNFDRRVLAPAHHLAGWRDPRFGLGYRAAPRWTSGAGLADELGSSPGPTGREDRRSSWIAAGRRRVQA